MMAAKEALHSLALGESDPEELLAAANRRIYQLASRSFVALGYLCPNGNGLRYSLAGQPAPILRHRDGSASSLALPPHRLPLGAMTRGRHTVLEVPIADGEILLAFSDGVIEAHSPKGELFGDDRLLAAVAAAPAEPQALVDSVLAALDRFTAGADAYDDVTLLAIARCSPRDDANAPLFATRSNRDEEAPDA